MRDPDLLHGTLSEQSLPSIAPGVRHRRRWTQLTLAVEPSGEVPPAVRYHWDADTEILTAHVDEQRGGGAATASVELEGRDGSWITLELRAGRFAGLEIAVWPPVRLRGTLEPPAVAEVAHVAVPLLQLLGGTTDVEIETVLSMEADRRERAFRLRVGRVRPSRAVRVARDILCDVDEAGELAGLWLLNVPPLQLPH